MKPRRIVDEMDSYVPGRSQDEIAQEFNLNKNEIIKLGSNENPWGPSPKAMEAIRDEIKSINRYPESQLMELVREMAQYSGVEENQVIVGGDGADEIIDVLAKTFIDEGDPQKCGSFRKITNSTKQTAWCCFCYISREASQVSNSE